MVKRKTLSTILLIMLLPMAVLVTFYPQAAGVDTLQSGPKIDVLAYKFFPLFGFDKEQAALVDGQVEMIPRVGSFEEAANLSSNSNLMIYRSTEGSTKLSSIFFNIRKSPFNDTAIRQAVSYLVDRAYICDTLLSGWVDPVTTFVPPLSPSWTNINAVAPDFDSQKARQILDNAGYVVNSLGWRNTPGSNETLDTVTILTPTWTRSAVLWDIGYTISYYMNATGIPTYHLALPDYILLERTMERRDFDICVMDVSLAHAPFGLYPLLHSSQDINGTFAFSGVHNSTLDSALETLWFGNDKAEVQKAVLDAQTYSGQLLPYLPVCSTPEIAAVRSSWTGVVNMPGFGADNFWTYLNVHPDNSPFGGSFVLSTIGNLSTLNPCIALQANEWNILQKIYCPLFYLDPSTLQETPMLAKNWVIENWTTPQGKNGMKVTFELEGNIVWQDNEPFTSSDIKFCIDYLKANNATTFNNILNKILSTNTPNDSTIEIYVNATGYKYLYDMAWFTILPEHIWKNVTDYQTFQPWTQTNPINNNLTMLVGQGPFILEQYDLNNGVTLVWNPLFFMSDPEKSVDPTPSPTPTASPTPSPTPTASPTPSSTPNTTPTPSTSLSPSSSPTPIVSPGPSPSTIPSPSPTPSPTPTASPTPSPAPSTSFFDTNLLLVATIAAVAVIALGLIIYFKKRKH